MYTTRRPESALAALILLGLISTPFAHAQMAAKSSLTLSEAEDLSTGQELTYRHNDSTPLIKHRVLNVTLRDGGTMVSPGGQATFKPYWNYDEVVMLSSIRVFKASDKHFDKPVAVIPFKDENDAVWQTPNEPTGDYVYVLRVYNAEGKYDETHPAPLKISADRDDESTADKILSKNSTIDNSAVTNIDLEPGDWEEAGGNHEQVKRSKQQISDFVSVKPPAALTRNTTLEFEIDGTKKQVVAAPTPQIHVGSRIRSAEARARFNVSFDGLSATPLLNVGLSNGASIAQPGTSIEFATYWNYSHWIEYAQIEIFDPSDRLSSAPIAVIPVDPANGLATWKVPQTGAREYSYKLKVFDSKDRSDETILKSIAIVSKIDELVESPTSNSKIYGNDASALRNINVDGGAITVSANSLNSRDVRDISVMGSGVSLDEDGDFATQEILPAGDHQIQYQYTNKDGQLITSTRTATIPESEVFFVAIGDLTVGTRSSEGRAFIEASGEDFEKNYVTGRGAFYLKGKIKGRYLLTASMDTTENDIENLFSDLSDKDPQSVLQRVDPDRYYPVYGDNSTRLDDAPTLGRFYVRIEDGDDHIVWGNFFTNVTQTEFAQIDRGLYGAKAEFNSEGLTSNGEKRVRAVAFAADPGTVPARQEFRGTGGSLYFLENQDVAIGSERLRIEVRDQYSGLVLETRELRPIVDYEIDYIQGRVVLARPLTATQLGDQIVRDGLVSGADVFLVARYEYTQTLLNIDGYSTGGRIEAWANDRLMVGVTAQNEQTGEADQTLVAADVTFRKSADTYLKAELAQTEGVGFDERASLDGGFTFAPLSAQSTEDDAAIAWRIEGAMHSDDLLDTDNAIKVTGYLEEIEGGFSGTGRLSPEDTHRAGLAVQSNFNEKTVLSVKYDEFEQGEIREETSVIADARYTFSAHWQAGIGLRYNDLTGPQSLVSGERTDIGFELRKNQDNGIGYYGFAQSTLDSQDTRSSQDRFGIGLSGPVFQRFELEGEISDGDGGVGAQAGVKWLRTDDEEYYFNVTRDADDFAPGILASQLLGNADQHITLGGRRRFSDMIVVYGEERVAFGDRSGLTHAYGLDVQPTDNWNFGASMEIGEIEDDLLTVEREAYTVQTGYSGEQVSAEAVLEWRTDEDGNVKRDSWFFRSNAALKITPDWSAILRYDRAESEFSGGAFFDGNYTRAQIAGAYRPVDNDRFNALFRYTFFEELPASSQLSNSAQSNLPAQESNILSIDGNYRVSNWLTLGGKLGYRDGEVAVSRESDAFVENNASLAVFRADLHIIKKWDALIEGRVLSVDASNDNKSGALAALYRHFGDQVKVGVGYNFTDFSDDLSDLSFDDDGFFLNVVAKF